MSVAGVFVLFLAIGVIGAMASGGMSKAAAVAPAPAPTVTVSVPGPERTVPGPETTVTATAPGPTITAMVPGPTVTATQTVTQPVTPQVCLDALAAADEVVKNAADGFQYASDGFGAVATMDPNALEAAMAKVNALKPGLDASGAKYAAARDACRSH